MNADIVINRLRVLINHFPFMSEQQRLIGIRKANEMLDKYFENGGQHIPIDLVEWINSDVKLGDQQ